MANTDMNFNCWQEVQMNQMSVKPSVFYHNVISFLWYVQNAMIPCHSQELLPFLSVMYFSLPPFSTNYLSILSHLILPLFLGLPLNLVVPKFIYNTLLGILFSPILCTCPNQCNLFNPIVSVTVGFLTLA
jgi:hypothetical protein